MKIEHVAVWVNDMEKMKSFYTRYFHATAGDKYINPVKKFESYFLSFEDGCRLELMHAPGVKDRDQQQPHIGIAHLAISVGSKENVNQMTEQLRHDGVVIAGEPRTTGDGYYESVVLDPEGNRIEITV